jgi:hypothetical protein
MLAQRRVPLLCLVGVVALTCVSCIGPGAREPEVAPTVVSLRPTSPPKLTITSSVATSDGAVWYAYDEFDGVGGSPAYSQNRGLFRLHDGAVSHFEVPGTIRVLRAGPDGSLYVGAGCGVLRFRNGLRETLAEVDCDRSDFAGPMIVFDIAIGQDGVVWAAGVYGLAQYDSAGWTEYGVNARRLLVAPDNTLWAEGWDGRAGSGCCYVHVVGNVVTTYTHSASLPVSAELLEEIQGLASR